MIYDTPSCGSILSETNYAPHSSRPQGVFRSQRSSYDTPSCGSILSETNYAPSPATLLGRKASAAANMLGKRALARPRPRPRPRTQTKTRQTQDRRTTTAVRSGRTDQARDRLDVAARLPSAVIEQRALPTASLDGAPELAPPGHSTPSLLTSF
ncbi:hypothetical protein J6590_053442 [Homalodisca vitripennis]|nr:hypothetical protein J6590_053442 [Homalodisca vitripennis]